VLRVNWNYIKAFVLLVLVCFLYAFSSSRNEAKKTTELQVNFLGDNNLFITHEMVNKLLIVNGENVTKVPKEILDLNGLENMLKSNAMIKTAEVYLAVNGKVRADVVQRKPIARVSTNASYYIDDEGQFMPLSTNYTAHVPIVTGSVEKNNLTNIFTVASKIYEDEFLKTHIVEIHQDQNQAISLKARVFNFEIILGDLNDLDKKINNLKAFYQKAKKDETLNTYSKVSLQFNNQVVCTKK
jgi:cell division protein FtsQ